MTNADDQSTQNDFTRRICFGVYAANRSFGRFFQAILSESGLTYPKFVILNTLKDAGPLTVSDLSTRAGVEPNTLSPLLKKMAGFGVLTRERDARDERRVMIALTDKGQELLGRADAIVLQGFAELGLDFEKSMRAVQFLEDLRSRLDKADPPKLLIDEIGS